MSRRRLVPAIVILLGLVGSAAAYATRPPFSRDAWLADYAQLRHEMEEAYANLDWKVRREGIDPVALHRQAEARLMRAGSNGEAREAILGFLAAFEDGHLHVAREPAAPVAWAMRAWEGRRRTPLRGSSRPAEACDALGYADEDNGFSLPFDAAGAIVVRSESPFRSALVSTGAGRIGIVRIPLFSPQAYRAACERAWPVVASRIGGGLCDEECEYGVHQAAGGWLAEALDETVTALGREGATAVIVDIRGNGGGSEWVDAAARAMTAAPLQGPRTAILRHAHSRRHLGEQAVAIEAALRDSTLSGAERTALAESHVAIRAMIDSTRVRCDASALWTSGPATVPCANTVMPPVPTATALEETAGTAGIRDWVTGLRFPSRSTARPGRYAGPLVLLADRRTASASEQFIAMLRDAGVARVVGEPTTGAGCGFTYGGIEHTLRHSGLRVRMPDCSRYWKDGSNEVAGIRPDVPLDAKAAPEQLAIAAVRAAIAAPRLP